MTKKIGLIVGSLRQKSWNRKVAEEIKTMFPAGYEVDFIEIKDLPLYNEDFDSEIPEPESYAPFRQQVEEADGFIFFTPEYNRSIAPALKNAIDIASRPYGQNKWNNKPVAVASASIGPSGGMASNLAIRQSFTVVGLMPMQMPEVYLSNVGQYFEEDGKMKESTRAFLQTFVDAFVEHVDRF